MEKALKSPKCRCLRCGKSIPEERAKLGIRFCWDCAGLVTRPYREVQVAATSLQWI